MITQRDIARRLGISVMAVSLALRGSRRVSGALRARVRRAAEEMGYRANPLVTSLMRARMNPERSETGTVVAWLGDGFPGYGSMKPDNVIRQGCLGAQAALERQGFKLANFHPDWRQADFRIGPVLAVLRARGIPGLIFGPHQPVEMDAGTFDHVALVQIGRSRHDNRFNRVTTDHFGNMHTCVLQLRQRGYTRIGMVETRNHNERSEKRWEAAHRLEMPEIPAMFLDMPIRLSGNAIRDYLRQYRLDALISAQPTVWNLVQKLRDPIGFATMRTEGFPDDVAGVTVNHRNLGRVAAEMVASLIYENRFGFPETPLTIAVPGTWREGKSIRPH